MTAQVARQQLEGGGAGFVFPGPNRVVGGAGPDPGPWLKPRGDSMGEREWSGEGLGLPWAAGGSEGLAGCSLGSRPAI